MSSPRRRKRLMWLLDELEGRRLEERYLYSREFRRRLESEVRRFARRYKLTRLADRALKYLDDTARGGAEAEEYRVEVGATLSVELPISALSEAAASAFTRKGFAVIVPGNFGSTLDNKKGVFYKRIWMNSAALMARQFRKLRLAQYNGPDQEHDASSKVLIEATELLHGYYDILRRRLKRDGFATVDFPYDWRKDIDNDVVALKLKALIRKLGGHAPVHIVTHSLGSHVARRALQLLKDDTSEGYVKGIVKHLVLLGPANYGTLIAALGLAAAIDEIPFADVVLGGVPTPPYLQKVMKSFTALYQVLPWDPAIITSLSDPGHNVCSPGFWGRMIDGRRLERALPAGKPAWAAGICTAFLKGCTTVVLGDAGKRSTAGGVVLKNGVMTIDHACDLPGDRWVPHVCSILKEGTATYIAPRIHHLGLPLSGCVIDGVIDIFNDKAPGGCLKPY
jgi:pimeloyl-ACP methyl ester carboxylesterase